MDILSEKMNTKAPSGVKTPSQMKTISGPGKETGNKYAGKKQRTLPVVGRKNR